MELKAFKDIVFNKAISQGFESCEIYYSSSDSFKVSVYNGKIEKFQNNSSSGFGFRGLFEGKMGYYFCEKIDESIVDTIVKNAKENAQLINNEDTEFIFEGSPSYDKVKTYDSTISELSVDEKINMAYAMEKYAKEYSDEIKSVDASVVSTGEAYTYIANTKNLELEERSNYFMGFVEATGERNGQIKNKYEVFAGTPKDFSPREIAHRCCFISL